MWNTAINIVCMHQVALWYSGWDIAIAGLIPVYDTVELFLEIGDCL